MFGKFDFFVYFCGQIQHKLKTMKTREEKPKYMKPAMREYEMRQTPQLLVASKPDYDPEEW